MLLTRIESDLELNCYIEICTLSISTFFNKKVDFEKYGLYKDILEINSSFFEQNIF